MARAARMRCSFLFCLFILLGFLVLYWDIQQVKKLTLSMESTPAPRRADAQKRVCMFLFMYSEAAVQQSYVRLFFESCRHAGIDFVVIGSPAPHFTLPPNVRHVHLTWPELTQLVADRVFDGKRLSALNDSVPIKVADFRPMVAFLFPELVKGYEWWGHLDYDMVLGNVSKFLTPTLLDQYDILCPVDTYKSAGPFTLYRNHRTLNELFKLSPIPLERIFNNSAMNVGFEEFGWGLRDANLTDACMSSIIEANAEKLGLRWMGSFNAIPNWMDYSFPKYCKPFEGEIINNTCTFTLQFTNDNTDEDVSTSPQQRIFHDHARLHQRIPYRQFSRYAEQHYERRLEFAFFHFDEKKKQVETLLSQANRALLNQILASGYASFIYMDDEKTTTAAQEKSTDLQLLAIHPSKPSVKRDWRS